MRGHLRRFSSSPHILSTSWEVLACSPPRAQSPRPAPRLALRPDGRGGRLRCPCLLASLLSCCRSLRLTASACLAWRRGVVRRMKKKRAGVFVFPVRLLLCLYDVVFALVVVVHEAWLTVAYFNKEMLFRNIRKALYTSECK